MSNRFWDLYEAELAISVRKKPDEYVCPEGTTPEEYAKRVRAKMQAEGMAKVNHNSATFRRLAKRLGIKYNRAELIKASAADDTTDGSTS